MAIVNLALAACAPEGTFDYPVSEAAEAADWPALYTGDARPVVPDAAADPAAPLQADAEALKARAALLRARADALSGPLLAADDPALQAFGR